MSMHTDYTSEEWETLKRAPIAAGLAVAYSSDSGSVGTAREESTLLKAFDHPSDEALGTPLIMEIIAAVRAELPAISALDSNEYLQVALRTCKDARTILDAKASANEAEGYKAWVISISQHVASESKEGGIWGIGGQRVSAAEAAALNQIAAVL